MWEHFFKSSYCKPWIWLTCWLRLDQTDCYDKHFKKKWANFSCTPGYSKDGQPDKLVLIKTNKSDNKVQNLGQLSNSYIFLTIEQHNYKEYHRSTKNDLLPAPEMKRCGHLPQPFHLRKYKANRVKEKWKTFWPQQFSIFLFKSAFFHTFKSAGFHTSWKATDAMLEKKQAWFRPWKETRCPNSHLNHTDGEMKRRTGFIHLNWLPRGNWQAGEHPSFLQRGKRRQEQLSASER